MTQDDDAKPRNAVSALEETFRARVAAGTWPPGTQLPSERTLADEFGVSHSTIKRALGFLHREGLLVGRQGKGHFVAGRPQRHITHTIAVVVANSMDLSYPIIARTMDGIREVLHDAGFNMNLMALRQRRHPPKHFTELFGATPIIDVAAADAAIVVDLPGGHAEPLYTLARHLPVVSSAQFLHGVGLACVLIDYGLGVFNALRHLHALGHRHVALLVPDDRNLAAHQQREGVPYALGCSPGLKVDTFLSASDAYLEEDGARAAERFWELRTRPTAVLCGSDELLAGFVEATLARGKRVPEDVSVIGWNDAVPSERFGVAFTTLWSDSHLRGRLCAECALELLKHPDRSPAMRTVPVELIVRDSTRPVRVSP